MPRAVRRRVTATVEELDRLKFHIKHLFSHSMGWDLSEQLSHISEYYAYLICTIIVSLPFELPSEVLCDLQRDLRAVFA